MNLRTSFPLVDNILGAFSGPLGMDMSAYRIHVYRVLNYLLIFGVKGYIPELGVTGAAISSCVIFTLQSLILLIFFLRRQNRETFATGNWKFDFKSFWRATRITAPPAILYNIEQIGWSVFYSMMTSASHTHITISSLCQSLILLFSFFGDGLARGVSVLANNFVGSGEAKLVKRVLKGSSYILILFFVLQILVLSLKPHLLIGSFLPAAEEVSLLGKSLGICVWFVLAFLMFQGFQWVLAYLLYAKGETFFVMLCGSCSLWACLIFPVYFLVLKGGYPPEWAWGLVAFYSATCSLLYFRRWKKSEPASVIARVETSTHSP